MKNECADYVSRNNFDALIGARSEALAKEGFSRMDVHLDLNITMIRPLDGLQQSEYLKKFADIYKRLEKRLEPFLVNQDQWKRDKSFLWTSESEAGTPKKGCKKKETPHPGLTLGTDIEDHLKPDRRLSEAGGG